MLRGAPLMSFIAVRSFATARSFYGDALGLEVTEESPFAMVLDAGGSMLRLAKVDDFNPQPFTVAGWQVTDMADAVDALIAKGIGFLRFDGMGQDEKGVWTTPGGDQVAWFKDPDGNTLSITQFAT